MFKKQSITIQDLKRNGAKALSESEVKYLIVNSKVKSAILPIDEYEMLLEALEELEDIKVIEQRKKEKTISFEEVKKQLG